jgi:ornithine cyclodeaminase
MSGAPRILGPEIEPALDWLSLTDALAAGHARRPEGIEDVVLRRGEDTLLSRAAWTEGLGSLVKTATVFPGAVPAVNGAACLFSDVDGRLEALVDFHLLTKWKTAGDSLLAARRLAPPDTRAILLVGAGTVAASLRQAYGAAFPAARFAVWARDGARARAFAQAHGAEPAPDLAAAVAEAQVIACATMATEPLIRGAWLRSGQHLDLIGAYRADMREADDAALRGARIFVDARATTLGHIGELKDPLARGVIAPEDVLADFFELDRFVRGADDVTLFKNGGGAHLDLITARWMLDRAAAQGAI